ncbi:hypothetical protein [Vibrio phage LV6]|nr:hypothetical protein [Vibrio phage LV6]
MFKFNPIKQALFEGFFQRIVSIEGGGGGGNPYGTYNVVGGLQCLYADMTEDYNNGITQILGYSPAPAEVPSGVSPVPYDPNLPSNYVRPSIHVPALGAARPHMNTYGTLDMIEPIPYKKYENPPYKVGVGGTSDPNYVDVNGLRHVHVRTEDPLFNIWGLTDNISTRQEHYIFNIPMNEEGVSVSYTVPDEKYWTLINFDMWVRGTNTSYARHGNFIPVEAPYLNPNIRYSTPYIVYFKNRETGEVVPTKTIHGQYQKSDFNADIQAVYDEEGNRGLTLAVKLGRSFYLRSDYANDEAIKKLDLVVEVFATSSNSFTVIPSPLGGVVPAGTTYSWSKGWERLYPNDPNDDRMWIPNEWTVENGFPYPDGIQSTAKAWASNYNAQYKGALTDASGTGMYSHLFDTYKKYGDFKTGVKLPNADVTLRTDTITYNDNGRAKYRKINDGALMGVLTTNLLAVWYSYGTNTNWHSYAIEQSVGGYDIRFIDGTDFYNGVYGYYSDWNTNKTRLEFSLSERNGSGLWLIHGFRFEHEPERDVLDLLDTRIGIAIYAKVQHPETGDIPDEEILLCRQVMKVSSSRELAPPTGVSATVKTVVPFVGFEGVSGIDAKTGYVTFRELDYLTYPTHDSDYQYAMIGSVILAND